MTNETELRELCERITHLNGSDQTRLLEMVLAENRRLHEEQAAAIIAAQAEYLERVKTFLELERQAAVGDKRAAG